MIKILKTGINVDKVVQQLKKYPQDWDHQKNLKDSQSLVDRGFADLPVSALQLIMGGVRDKEDFVGDSEINIKTPAYAHHSEIRKIIRKQFKNAEIHRCGFLSLPVDEIVGFILMKALTTRPGIDIICLSLVGISISVVKKV